MIPNYLYIRNLHFNLNVVISNSFNCIFETDVLHDSIN